MILKRPDKNEYNQFYDHYVQLAHGNSLNELFELGNNLVHFYNSIPEELGTYQYAANKWSIKQLLQHVVDTERIFAFRLLCIFRGEQQALPGFDENLYADSGNAEHRTLQEIQDEFASLRHSTNQLLKSGTNEDFSKFVIASGHKITGRALSFIIFGHAIHHKNILQERYGIK